MCSREGVLRASAEHWILARPQWVQRKGEKDGPGVGVVSELLHVQQGGCWVRGGSLKWAVDWASVLQKNLLGKSNGYATCLTESRKTRTPSHVFLLRQNSSDIHGGNTTLNHLRTEVYLQGIISIQMIARALILAQTQN